VSELKILAKRQRSDGLNVHASQSAALLLHRRYGGAIADPMPCPE